MEKFIRRFSLKIYNVADLETIREGNLHDRGKNTNPSSDNTSHYLNQSDIQKKAIQLFHTDRHYGGKGRHRINNRAIIHPNGRFRSIFDMATVVWVLLLVFFIPFEVGFSWYNPPYLQMLLMDLLDFWFALDIILNFRTGYIHHGTIIMKPEKITSNYITTWFFVDLLGTIPFEKFMIKEAKSRKSLKLIKYFKIPKLIRISRIMKYINVQKHMYDVFQIIFLLFTLLHIGACVWVLVLDVCDEENGVLIADHICEQEKVWHVYAEAVHVSAVMMLGVSNVHIIAGNSLLDVMMEPREGDKYRLYIASTCYMVGGLFIIALLISEMNVYFIGKSHGSAAFQRRKDRVRHEMEYYGLPHDLQVQVKAYYNYVWIHQKQYDDKIALISDHQMSTDLQRKLALHLFKDVISHISFFSEVDDLLLGEICLSLRTRIFLPNDMIIFKGDVGKELFIIAKGVVEVLRDDLPPRVRDQSPPILLRNGSFFGEIALVMEVRRTCSVQARTVCEVSILAQKAFDAILSENPEFARRMNELVVARQLDKHLAKSGATGVNFQVSRRDLDLAVNRVEKNMKQGLQRRLKINGEYDLRDPAVRDEGTKSMPNFIEGNSNSKKIGKKIENVIRRDRIEGVDSSHKESNLHITKSTGKTDSIQHKITLAKNHKGNIPEEVSTMFDDITRRSTRFPTNDNKKEQCHSKKIFSEDGKNHKKHNSLVSSRMHKFFHHGPSGSDLSRTNSKEKEGGSRRHRVSRHWNNSLRRMSEDSLEKTFAGDYGEEDEETLKVVGGYSPRHSVVDIMKVRPSILMSSSNRSESFLKLQAGLEGNEGDKKEIENLQKRLSLQDETLRKVLSQLERLDGTENGKKNVSV